MKYIFKIIFCFIISVIYYPIAVTAILFLVFVCVILLMWHFKTPVDGEYVESKQMISFIINKVLPPNEYINTLKIMFK